MSSNPTKPGVHPTATTANDKRIQQSPEVVSSDDSSDDEIHHPDNNGNVGGTSTSSTSRSPASYERAIQRALAENSYLTNLNSQLLTKLNATTSDHKIYKENLKKMKHACEAMKEVMLELKSNKDNAEMKVRKLEKLEVERHATLKALEVRTEETVLGLKRSLEATRGERDVAREELKKTMAGSAVLPPSLPMVAGGGDTPTNRDGRGESKQSAVVVTPSPPPSSVVVSENKVEEDNDSEPCQLLKQHLIGEKEELIVRNEELAKQVEILISAGETSKRKCEELSKDLEAVKAELKDSVDEREELLASRNVAQEETKELANDLEACQSRLEMASDSVEALSAQLDAARAEKANGERKATLSAEQLASFEIAEISTLEAKRKLAESKQAEQRLGNALKSMERDHAATIARLEDEKNAAMDEIENQKLEMAQQMAQQIEEMTAKIDETTRQKEDLSNQMNTKISSLEADLLESRRGEERLSSALETAENDHAAAQASLENDKVGFLAALSRLEDEKNIAMDEIENQKLQMAQQMAQQIEEMTTKLDETSRQKEDLSKQMTSQIVALETSLFESTQETERLGTILKSIESTRKEELVRLESEKIDVMNDLAKQIECLSSDLEISKAKCDALRAELEEERLDGDLNEIEGGHVGGTERMEEENNATIVELGGQNRDLAQRVACLSAGGENATGRSESLRAELDSAREEKQELTQRIASLLTEMETSKKGNESLAAELESAKKAASREHARLLTDMVALEADLFEARQVEERLVDVVRKLEGSHAKALKGAEEEKDAAIGELERNMHDIVEHSLGEMEEQLEKMSSEREELTREVFSLSSSLDSANDEILTLTKLLEEDKLTIDNGTEERKAMRSELIAKETVEVELRSKVEELSSSVATLEKERDELATKLDDLNQVEANLLESKHGVATKEAELESMQELKDNIQHEMKIQQGEVSEINADKEAEVGKLQDELGGVKTSLVGANTDRDELSAENKSLHQQMEILQINLDDTTASKGAEIRSLETKIDKISAAKDAMQEEIDALQSNVLDVTAAKEAAILCLQKEFESARTSLADTSTKKDELSAKNDNLQQQIETLQNKVSQRSADNEAEVGNLREALSSVKKQLDDSKGHAQKLADELKAYQSQIKIVENANERLSEELQTERKTLNEDTTAKLNEMLQLKENLSEQLGTKIAALEVDLLASKQDCDAKATKIEHLQGELETAQRSLADATMNRDKLSSSIDLMQKNMFDITKRKSELSAENDLMQRALKSNLQSLQSQKANLLKTVEEKNAVIDDLECQKQGLTQRIKTLSAEFEGADAKSDSLSTEVNDAKKAASEDTERLNAKLSSLEADLHEPRQHEERLISAMESTENSHTAALALLEDEKNAVIDELECQKRETAQRIESLSAEVKDATTKIDSLNTELNDTKEGANQELERLNTKILSLEADLLESRKEGRLDDAMKSAESSHAKALARVEDEKNATIQDLEKKMDEILEQSLGGMKQQLKRTTLEKEELEKKMDEILEQSLGGMEEQLKRTTSEKEEKSREVISLSVLLDSSEELCYALTKQLKEDKVFHDKEKEAMSLKLSAKEKIEAEFLTEREKISSSAATLVKERDELVIELDEFKRKGDITNALIKDLQSQHDASIEKISELSILLESCNAEKESLSEENADLAAEISQVRDDHNSIQDELDSLTKASTAEKNQFDERVKMLEKNKQLLIEKEKERCDQIQELIQQVDDAESSLEKSESECKSLSEKYHELGRESEEQCKQIVQLNSELGDETSKTAELVKSLEDKEAEVENLSHELAQVQCEKEAAMTKVERLSEELKSTATTLSDVQELISADQKQATEMRSKIKSLEMEKICLEESILSVKRDRDDVEAKLDFSREEAEDFRCKMKSFESLAETMTNQCEQLASDRDNIEAKLGVAILESEELRCKLDSSESLAGSLTKQCEELTSDRDDFQTKLKLSQQESEDFKCKMESSKSRAESMADQCKQLGSDRDDVEAKLEVARQEIIDLMDKLESSESLVESMTNRCEQLTGKIAELSTKHNATVKELRLEHQHNITRWRRQEETNQSEISCLEDIVFSLKKEYEAFKVEARSATATQMRSCEAKLKTLCAADENSTLRQQELTFNDMIAIIQKERTVLLEEVKSMAKELEIAQCEKSCLENIISSLKNEYEAFKVEAKAATAALMRSCETKLETVCVTNENGSLPQQGHAFDDMIERIQKEHSHLYEKAISVSKELEAAQDEKSCLEKTISSLKKELGAAEDESFILEQQVHILSKEVSKYKLQNKGMLQAFDEITHVKHDGGDKNVPMNQVAVDKEVEKRLMSFRHKI